MKEKPADQMLSTFGQRKWVSPIGRKWIWNSSYESFASRRLRNPDLKQIKPFTYKALKLFFRIPISNPTHSMNFKNGALCPSPKKKTRRIFYSVVQPISYPPLFISITQKPSSSLCNFHTLYRFFSPSLLVPKRKNSWKTHFAAKSSFVDFSIIFFSFFIKINFSAARKFWRMETFRRCESEQLLLSV